MKNQNGKKARPKNAGHILMSKNDRATRESARRLAEKYGVSYLWTIRLLDNINASMMWLRGESLDDIGHGYNWCRLMTEDIVGHWHQKILELVDKYPALLSNKSTEGRTDDESY
jgi:hypothetical protein